MTGIAGGFERAGFDVEVDKRPLATEGLLLFARF
jgi:hypothetical protein